MCFQIFRIPIDCQPQHLEPVAQNNDLVDHIGDIFHPCLIDFLYFICNRIFFVFSLILSLLDNLFTQCLNSLLDLGLHSFSDLITKPNLHGQSFLKGYQLFVVACLE